MCGRRVAHKAHREGEGQDRRVDVPNDGLHLDGGLLVLLLCEQASDFTLGHPVYRVVVCKKGEDEREHMEMGLSFFFSASLPFAAPLRLT